MLFGDGRPDRDLTAHSAPIGNWRFVRSYYLVLLNALKKKLFEEKKHLLAQTVSLFQVVEESGSLKPGIVSCESHMVHIFSEALAKKQCSNLER